MHTLSIVSALVAIVGALVALLGGVSARVHADRCRKWSAKWAAMHSRMLSAESALESLTTQHQKLNGRFYAYVRAAEDDERPEKTAVPLAPAIPATAGPVCENWLNAKRDGPGSPAAACECDFCTHERARRRELKERLVPKGQAARVKAMRDGLAQP